ncbi:MAG: class I SAM-dependent methyltransferase [Jatrophihabitans sp.]|uniref:class I SAM-dependent methyltransferase n=1 Tax=Jatrophihabitans sp. TaxID=1932789 RepID=UPI003F7E4E57
MTGYVYDQGWHDERARLAGLEALWDAGTRSLATRLQVGPGASVLEVGAGGGSVVEWLAQVGATVTAVDLDTRFVEPLSSATVSVHALDVVADALPGGAYDLVHARLLLEHLPAREAVLDKLVAALRPGGWLLVEDYDWTGFGTDPGGELETRSIEGILEFMRGAGHETNYGRRLASSFAARGLVEVFGEGRSHVIDAAHPGYPFFALSFAQLAPPAVDAGTLSADDAATMGPALTAGEYRIITPTLFAAAGRRPA